GMLQRQTLAGPIDYVSIADAETLEELVNIDRPAVVSLAVRFGPTRLIDNITLPPP
ncbi:MAG: pantoate--beta-alanine ligase, partial [Chloroflexi bacterium]|nr:pantoate--beta-alanine ligase [Chloroflexota bacterium]